MPAYSSLAGTSKSVSGLRSSQMERHSSQRSGVPEQRPPKARLKQLPRVLPWKSPLKHGQWQMKECQSRNGSCTRLTMVERNSE